jgi:UDP-N-acetylmuramoylalanine--D-glutamate ligase
MLKEDGKRVGVGGNVGEPLVLFTNGKDRWDVLVVEISSFQLEAIEDFRPRISVLLNITEDHLDRYARYEDYIEAKMRIFANQNSGDLAILNRDDPIVMQYGEKVKAKKVLFSLREKLGEGAFQMAKDLLLGLKGGGEIFLIQGAVEGIHWRI